jgi:CRP/FNR family cyclic AMP-dependent transcriptional regulator
LKLKPEQEQDAYQTIQELHLFSGCPEEALKAIVSRLDAREVAAGKVILMDQEIARTLSILSKGSVAVWKRVGGEKQQLAILEAPNFFGERSMFEESPASAMVKAHERCVIYDLTRAQFDEVAAQYPAIIEPIKENMELIRKNRITPGAVPKSNPE